MKNLFLSLLPTIWGGDLDRKISEKCCQISLDSNSEDSDIDTVESCQIRQSDGHVNLNSFVKPQTRLITKKNKSIIIKNVNDVEYWKHHEILDVYTKQNNLVMVIQNLNEREGRKKFFIKFPLNCNNFLGELHKRNEKNKQYVLQLNTKIQKILNKLDKLNFECDDQTKSNKSIQYSSSNPPVVKDWRYDVIINSNNKDSKVTYREDINNTSRGNSKKVLNKNYSVKIFDGDDKWDPEDTQKLLGLIKDERIYCKNMVGHDIGEQTVDGRNIEENIERRNWERKDFERHDFEMRNLRRQNPNMQHLEIQNLEIQNLKGQNLKGQNLKGQNLKGQNLKGQNSNRQNLERQNLDSQNLESQNLERQNLERQNLESQNLESQNSNRQNLKSQNSEMQNSEMQNLRRQSLEMQNLKRQSLNRKNLVIQNLEIQDLEVQDLEVQDFEMQDLEMQDLEMQDLEMQDLEMQNLETQNLVMQNLAKHNSKRQNSDRQNSERQNSERQNSERPNSKRQNSERQNSERQNSERQNSERQNSKKQNSEKQNSERQNLECQNLESPNLESPNSRRLSSKSQNLERQYLECQNLESPNSRRLSSKSQNLDRQNLECKNLERQNLECQNLERQNLEYQNSKSPNSRRLSSKSQNLQIHHSETQSLKSQNSESHNLEGKNFQRPIIKNQNTDSQDIEQNLEDLNMVYQNMRILKKKYCDLKNHKRKDWYLKTFKRPECDSKTGNSKTNESIRYSKIHIKNNSETGRSVSILKNPHLDPNNDERKDWDTKSHKKDQCVKFKNKKDYKLKDTKTKIINNEMNYTMYDANNETTDTNNKIIYDINDTNVYVNHSYSSGLTNDDEINEVMIPARIHYDTDKYCMDDHNYDTNKNPHKTNPRKVNSNKIKSCMNVYDVHEIHNLRNCHDANVTRNVRNTLDVPVTDKVDPHEIQTHKINHHDAQDVKNPLKNIIHTNRNVKSNRNSQIPSTKSKPIDSTFIPNNFNTKTRRESYNQPSHSKFDIQEEIPTKVPKNHDVKNKSLQLKSKKKYSRISNSRPKIYNMELFDLMKHKVRRNLIS